MAGHGNADDPRCPECGEPIGVTATYCMHCSADLTEEHAGADADGDGYWDTPTGGQTVRDPAESDGKGLFHPDGPVDNTLTGVVGIAGALVVSAIGTFVLVILTSSGWMLLAGMVVGILAAAHLARQPTVHDAVARTAYGVAIVLLLVPLIAFAQSNGDTDLVARVVVFAMLLGGVAIPAAIVAGFGVTVSMFAPGDDGPS